MAKKLLVIIVLISNFCFGQITFEQPFYDGVVQRVVLEHSGEKYFVANRNTNKLNFFNADYSFWKTIDLTVPVNNLSIFVSHVSENKLNSDNLLEIIYSTYSASGFRQCKIINENGLALLTVNNDDSLSLNEKVGLPTKIMCTSMSTNECKVYSVPELNLEHTYSISDTRRVILENSGEKYYNFNHITGIVTIYNNNHTFWKNITLTKPVDYSFSGVSFLSENQINADNLIEIGYGYYINGASPAKESKIINENNLDLLTISDCNRLYVSEINGLSTKLIATTYNNFTEITSTQVVSLPNFILEHTYIGNVSRCKLEISGEKYFDNSLSECSSILSNPQTVIYNNNHTVWKTIPLPNAQFGSIYAVPIENLLSYDTSVKLLYTINSCTLNGGYFSSSIVNEDGTALINIPSASGIYFSKLPNLPTKLLVSMHNNYGFPNITQTSRVYGLDGGVNFSVEDFNLLQVAISPNPTSFWLEFKSENSIIKKAVIYDLQGKVIQTFEDENIQKIDVQKLNTGIYIIKLTDENNKSHLHKIVKN